jgi:hypothetical protein
VKGRRDLKSGPLAPQAGNINHLKITTTENKRLVAVRFGRQMDAKTPSLAVWTPPWIPERALTRSHAFGYHGRVK